MFHEHDQLVHVHVASHRLQTALALSDLFRVLFTEDLVKFSPHGNGSSVFGDGRDRGIGPAFDRRTVVKAWRWFEKAASVFRVQCLVYVFAKVLDRNQSVGEKKEEGKSMDKPIPYIGSKISLVSKSEIRYVGTCSCVRGGVLESGLCLVLT